MQGPAAKKTEEPDVHRLRLLEGLAAAVSERGYAATTIADIVKAARVSKRTFYEHFEDKEECLLALYTEATDIIRKGIELAFGAPAPTWQAQLEAGLDAYLTALEANPALTRACLLEIQAAGPRALALRVRSQAKFAAMLRAFIDRTRIEHPHVRALSAAMATAIVGGIDALLLANIERNAKSMVTDMRETAADLTYAVLGVPR